MSFLLIKISLVNVKKEHLAYFYDMTHACLSIPCLLFCKSTVCTFRRTKITIWFTVWKAEPGAILEPGRLSRKITEFQTQQALPWVVGQSVLQSWDLVSEKWKQTLGLALKNVNPVVRVWCRPKWLTWDRLAVRGRIWGLWSRWDQCWVVETTLSLLILCFPVGWDVAFSLRLVVSSSPLLCWTTGVWYIWTWEQTGLRTVG